MRLQAPIVDSCNITGFSLPMQDSLATLKSAIERLSATEAISNPDKARPIFFDFRAALTRGEVRAAEKIAGSWVVNPWVKQGILLGFRLGELQKMSDGDVLSFIDKDTFPARRLSVTDRVRLVPGGSSIREGAYVAPIGGLHASYVYQRGRLCG